MHRRFPEEQPGLANCGQTLQPLDHALQAASRAEKRLREAIEALPQGIVFLDEEDRYILWNRQYAEIYARSADLLKPGVKLADTLRIGVERGDYPEAVGHEEEWLTHRLAQLRQPGRRHEQWLSNGRCIMIEERRIEGCGTIGVRVDITDLKHKEENFRLLFERNPVAMLVYDLERGMVRSANDAACAFFGYAAHEMAGLAAGALFPEVLWPSASEMLATDYYSGSNDCWQMLRRDGSGVEAVIATRLSQLEGYPATIVSIFDVTERRRIEQRMAHMARHDELTGLANRSHCREHLIDVLGNAGPNETITIALVDLDHFKAVNDTYGHMFGDAVLTEAARRMFELIPPDALLCRIGGDEFAIIFRRCSLTQAELVARSMITTLSEPFFVRGHLIHIGATVGLASSPYDSSDPETLMRYADLALYAAKDEQRGICRAFEARMDIAAQEKNRLEKDFRAAVRNDELEVHYQPLVNLETGDVECYEALLRWNHPTRGLVPPDVFVPIAEEMGLIDQIGRLVLYQACVEATLWPEHIKVSINVSPLQFRNGNLLSTVINALSTSGLCAERLELEITEAVLMEKGPRPAAIIRNLRAFGIGISLDDFGTGYSSLSYLLNYPFTKIKIDKSFILNLDSEANSRAVIRAVIGLGRSIGLTVAAEGIESEVQRDYLREEGCLQGQGYLFGKPEPASALIVPGRRAA
ncbi:putative bifunctional diguanylate cyclase/phosphodiesterase [Novosphingobium mangrovi (ex Huang et al. 2023)]|uniref:EAL domain-containing protein n=1 Tax=Novosphingobium mangrovi (ex Huang et al. 2023) TaxID=2976432 RepID=A0ABT2I4S2_9SPHN|nr:EAL domain-containing protein [Novosphingobium mangrovi (ex Huang et al. 2023)]MCT2399802.1 EAL domain-containing protein [Novosphingobium mangrovi (ex Huang et al. 2023)]